MNIMTNEDKFWELVSKINWYDITVHNNGNLTECENCVIAILTDLNVSLDEIVMATSVLNDLETKLFNRIVGYSLGKYGDFRFPYKDMKESTNLEMYSLITHVIGLGKAMFYTVMRNPKFVSAFTDKAVSFGLPLHMYLNKRKGIALKTDKPNQCCDKCKYDTYNSSLNNHKCDCISCLKDSI